MILPLFSQRVTMPFLLVGKQSSLDTLESSDVNIVLTTLVKRHVGNRCFNLPVMYKILVRSGKCHNVSRSFVSQCCHEHFGAQI